MKRGEHAVGVWHGERGSAVRAAAVCDDHLVPSRAQRLQRLQGADNARGLVQHRNDDGQPPCVPAFTHRFLASFSVQSYSRNKIGALPSATSFCWPGSPASSLA